MWVLLLSLAVAQDTDTPPEPVLGPEALPPMSGAPSSAPAEERVAAITAWSADTRRRLTRELVVPITVRDVELVASIRFDSGEDGEITGWSLQESSGVPAFDEAAKRAVEAVLPDLPPLPEEARGTSVILLFRTPRP